MSKKISVTAVDLEALIAEMRFEANKKIYGNFNFNKKFNDDRKATLMITPEAYCKIIALVSEFETEVQWHGLVKRVDESTFMVYDILVPPHSVSAARVDSDPAEYEAWTDKLSDEEFKAMRFHGHSHVRMGCTPSGTDNQYRRDIVNSLPRPTENNDVFYIFMIWNKNAVWTAEIYDVSNNALYESGEIKLKIMFEDGKSYDEFISEAKSLTKRMEVVTYTQQKADEKKSEDKKSENKKESAKQSEESKQSKKSDYDYDKDYFRRHGYYGGLYDDDDFDIYGPFGARGV